MTAGSCEDSRADEQKWRQEKEKQEKMLVPVIYDHRLNRPTSMEVGLSFSTDGTFLI